MTVRYSGVSEVPLALAVFLATDNYDYNSEPNTISATTLLKPLRQIILPSRIPAGEGLVNLSDMMSNRKGSAVHDAIERAWLTNHVNAMRALGFPQRIIDRIVVNPDRTKPLGPDQIPVYLEQRLSKPYGKWIITGKFDFVGDGRVQDVKTASVWSYMNQVNKLKQCQQGSLYRWLAPDLITKDEMDIHHIFMDWKSNMAKSDPRYPTKAFITQKIPLLSLHETETFIRNKVNLIEQYWDADEEAIPECDSEELWRSEPVFKYYKNPLKTARSTKNFETQADAMLRYIEDGSVGIVKEKPGQVTACKYCSAFAACSQKDALIASGDLILN